jgi:hypothetical protein
MEVIETVTLSKATSIEYVKLREIWNDILAKGEMPEYVTIHEDIDAMIALIYLNTRAHRVKNSPKVKELASKYPDIDIQSIVAVSLLKDKIQLV